MRIIRVKSGPIARAISLLWWERIYLGPGFDRLDADVQAFVVAHECGHIARSHTERRILKLLVDPGGLAAQWIEFEYEADLFAAMMGHSEAAHRFLATCRGGPRHPSGLQRRWNLIKHGFHSTGPVRAADAQGTA